MRRGLTVRGPVSNHGAFGFILAHHESWIRRAIPGSRLMA